MEVLPYILVMLVLTSLLTLARINVVTLNTNTTRKKIYAPIGNLLLLITYFIFIIFTIFRVIDLGLGGIDAYNYKNIFLNAGGNIVESLSNQFYEPGYATLIWLARLLSEDYRVALFIVYTIMFLLLINFIKYISFNKYTPLTIFLLLTLWIDSFNTTRVILAIFIGTLVYTLLYKKKLKMAVFIAIIATTVHVSAIVLILVVVIVIIIQKRDSFRPTQLILFITGLMTIFFITGNLLESIVMGGRYEIYLEYKEGELALGTYFISFIVSILAFTKYNSLLKLNEYNKILVITLPICLSLIVLQLNFSIVYRMVLFFLPILYSLIPDLIRSMKIKRNQDLIKVPIKISLVGYLLYRVYSFWLVEIDSAGIPYVNSLF